MSTSQLCPATQASCSGDNILSSSCPRAFELVDTLLDTLERHGGEFTVSEVKLLEEKLVAATSAVRTIRNAFSPAVGGLLPETLSLIFRMVQEESSDFLPKHRCSREVYSWTKITHVCRYWRDTALADPSLWSTLNSYNKNALRASLDRSIAAPLSVSLFSQRYNPCPALDDIEILRALASNSSRFQQFHLRQLCPHNLRALILHYFRFPAPHLESLTIALDEEDSPTSSNLPPLFAGHTPKLRRLTLRYFTSWTSNSLANLTHVCLYHQNEFGRVTVSQFLDFLQSCPLLEELVLVDAGPAIADLLSAPQPYNAIDMNCLRILDIGLWPSAFAIGSFLGHLRLPRSVAISMWGRGILNEEESMVSLFPESSLQRANISGITQLRLTYSNTSGRSLPFIAIRDSALQINGNFTLDQVLLSLSQTCSLLEVTELWLGDSFEQEPTDEQWRSLFHCMPSLTTLVIIERHSEPILSALTLRDGVGTSMACPKLHTIIINGCHPSGVSTLFLSVLARERETYGRPLQRLRVSIYSLTPALKNEILYLQKQIVSVECDGEYEDLPKAELIESWPTTSYLWMRCENA